jgi:hypothetical protein
MIQALGLNLPGAMGDVPVSDSSQEPYGMIESSWVWGTTMQRKLRTMSDIGNWPDPM